MITYHDLNGFDMVYALTGQTITNQFKLLYALGVLPSSWKASIKKGLYSIDATLGAPLIDLNTGDSSARKVNLVIPLIKAIFNYASIKLDDDGNPIVERHQADISGSKLQLTANLGLAEVAASYKDATHIPSEVKKQLSTFNSSMFSIQHLFMNLEDANLLDTFKLINAGQIDMTQPEIINQVHDLVQAYVNSIKDSGNPYILGYSVTDKNVEGSDATWKPTGVTFSLYSDAAYPLRSSLNYLLETQGKPVPGGGAGIFPNNWVTKDDVQGSFVFSQELVLKQVLDSLTTVISVSKDSFTAVDNSHFTSTFTNDIGGQTTITISPVNGTNTITISFHATFKKDMHDKAGSYIGYIDGWMDWVNTISFTVDSKTHTISTSVSKSEPTTYRQDHPNSLGEFEKVLAIFADFLISLSNPFFASLFHPFEDMAKGDWNTSVSTNVSVAIQTVSTHIILPAGKQLLFKDCLFMNDGTMLITTTIQN